MVGVLECEGTLQDEHHCFTPLTFTTKMSKTAGNKPSRTNDMAVSSGLTNLR